MKPKVSVIMIAYNQADTIGEAIRSVVLQKAPFPFELIVADDASTDSTLGVARQWQERYPDIIRVISRPANLGLQANFLDAWAQARGEYIAICEGDDHWCSRYKLRRQAEWLDTHPECALTFHRVWNHYADTRTLSLSNPRQPRDITLETLARGNVITNLSVMYRAIPASELPGWISEIKLFDYAFHSLHLARGTGRFMPQPMAVYRRYSCGIWSGDPQRALRLALDVREHLIAHFAGSHPEAAARYAEAADAIRTRLATPGDTSQPKPSLLSKIRAAVSRFLPVPRIV